MPFKRIDKNKKVISERGTRQPTADELETAKRKEIEQQNKTSARPVQASAQQATAKAQSPDAAETGSGSDS